MLLVAQVGQRRVVMARCERARAAGVRIGMAVGDAGAMFDHERPRIEDYKPERDRAVLRSLAVWAQRFSPIVAVDEPDGLLLDASGCGQVFGGEERHLRVLLRGLAGVGFRARAAMAPTFACAWAMARFGVRVAPDVRLCGQPVTDALARPHRLSPTPPATTSGGTRGGIVVPEGESRRAIEGLPVRALRLERATVEALREVGVERVGQLLALPRGSLPSRFGEEILFRVDQALGLAMETINPVRPVPALVVERVFDGPTTQLEAISLTVHRLLREVAGRLRVRESGARRLDLTLGRSDLPPAVLELGLSRASRDERHLWSLIRPRLERMPLGYGVEKIALGVPWAGRIRHQQMEHWRDEAADAEIEQGAAELVDTLVNRLGAERVAQAEMVGSHIPERAFRMRAWQGSTAFRPAKRAADGCQMRQHLVAGPRLVSSLPPPPVKRAGEVHTGKLPWVGVKQKNKPVWEEIWPGDWPPVLLAQPGPAQVIALTPDGPVMSVRWEDQELRITRCIGPERIGAEWWRDRPVNLSTPTRDYFKVQDQHGRWLWLTRQVETGRWFVHGVWA